MTERKLGEQWVGKSPEDGKMHMYKAVEVATRGLCSDIVVKDLGILNKDGCLPSAWDKALYPQVYRTTETIWYAHAESYGIFMEAKGNTKQEAIDAWNRRA